MKRKKLNLSLGLTGLLAAAREVYKMGEDVLMGGRLEQVHIYLHSIHSFERRTNELQYMSDNQ